MNEVYETFFFHCLVLWVRLFTCVCNGTEQQSWIPTFVRPVRLAPHKRVLSEQSIFSFFLILVCCVPTTSTFKKKKKFGRVCVKSVNRLKFSFTCH
jgi:hypothetical protein